MGTTATVFLISLVGLWIIGFVYIAIKFNQLSVKDLTKELTKEELMEALNKLENK